MKLYKNDNLDAYSKFDAYKRIASMISNCKSDIIVTLEKIIINAQKYGATAEELRELTSEVETIQKLDVTKIYSDILKIPEIQSFNNEKNAQIVEIVLI